MLSFWSILGHLAVSLAAFLILMLTGVHEAIAYSVFVVLFLGTPLAVWLVRRKRGGRSKSHITNLKKEIKFARTDRWRALKEVELETALRGKEIMKRSHSLYGVIMADGKRIDNRKDCHNEIYRGIWLSDIVQDEFLFSEFKEKVSLDTPGAWFYDLPNKGISLRLGYFGSKWTSGELTGRVVTYAICGDELVIDWYGKRSVDVERDREYSLYPGKAVTIITVYKIDGNKLRLKGYLMDQMHSGALIFPKNGKLSKENWYKDAPPFMLDIKPPKMR
ncbi:MAG: hypothetical protein FWE45_02285 [Firmicutes bacterium]|nr:hypothetical protein [Bacillota bacterium]